jgi:hypothetical protein
MKSEISINKILFSYSMVYTFEVRKGGLLMNKEGREPQLKHPIKVSPNTHPE